HSLETPETMQMSPDYTHLLDAVCNQLMDSINIAIETGVKKENIIIDPGIGFGKTTNHNMEIIQRISEIVSLNYPVLVGVSRKSFIGNLLDLPVDEREDATSAVNSYLISQGVDILRIHDVKKHTNSIKMLDLITKSKF
ncbi:MAG: dihydropteroate synthase, partial [Vampirovibrionia bacterium]